MKALVCAVSFLFATTVFAAAPKSTTSNPGFYHFPLGGFEVTTISDGYIKMPVTKFLSGAPPKTILSALNKNFLGEEVEGSVDAFLVNTGAKLVLVDTGSGKMMGPTAGHFFENLKAAGYTPDQVDVILITHAHPDHLGGLTADGKIAFPNATVYLDKKELDFMMDPKTKETVPKEFQAFIDFGVQNLTPYQKAGKLTPITGDGEIVPGVSARAAHAHTPGHSSYVFRSEGQTLILLGDFMHVGSVQFEHPEVSMVYDADKKASAAQRNAILAAAAKNGDWIGAAHLPFPGIGHVRKEKVGYTFVPMNYHH